MEDTSYQQGLYYESYTGDAPMEPAPFEEISWKKSPLRLLTTEAHSPGALRLSPKSIEDAEKKVHSTRRESSAALGEGFERERSLWRTTSTRPYESYFGIREKKTGPLLAEHAKTIGSRALNVLDFGCGVGEAVSDLVKLDVVSRSDTFGVTLPCPNIREDVRQNIICANILDLAPKELPQGGHHRFDVVMSCFGGIFYHPLNPKFLYRTYEVSSRVFGVLHALNFLKEGGLLFKNPTMGIYFEDSMGSRLNFLMALQKMGVVETPQHLRRFMIKHEATKDRVVSLVRRPTVEEIRWLLLADKFSGEYEVSRCLTNN